VSEAPPEGEEAPRFVRITYLDHIEFENEEHLNHATPSICSTTGTIHEETETFVRLIWIVENIDSTPSFQGMVVLKSCILKVEELTISGELGESPEPVERDPP
jgi:hypothetical protein